MNNGRTLKATGIVLVIIGIIVLIIGLYKVNDAERSLSTLEAAGRYGGYDDSYYRGVNAWNKHVEIGKNIETAGFVTGGIGLVFFLVGLTQIYADERTKSIVAEITNNTNVIATAYIRDRISVLDRLMDSGVITEEEYNKKRTDVLNSFSSSQDISLHIS